MNIKRISLKRDFVLFARFAKVGADRAKRQKRQLKRGTKDRTMIEAAEFAIDFIVGFVLVLLIAGALIQWLMR